MLDRIPEQPPIIAPVPMNEVRPLWSVMIPTYNCIHYLRQTIESVLIQDPGPEKMQIEVVDDCSTDGDVAALVAAVGKGRVLFYQQVQNRGSLRNFETCLNRAKGHWVHLLHGDDIVKAGFYKEAENLFTTFPQVGSAIIHYTQMNEKGVESKPGGPIMKKPGIIENWLPKIATRDIMIQPPAVVVKRSVYEHLGGFFGVHYGEDWEMWIRIAAHYPVAYSPKCLAVYRGGHSTNISSSYVSTGRNFTDLNKVIDITQAYLPANQKRKLKNKAKKNFSLSFANASIRILKNYHNPETALIQAKGALKMHKNWRTIYCVIRFYFLYFQNKWVYASKGKNS